MSWKSIRNAIRNETLTSAALARACRDAILGRPAVAAAWAAVRPYDTRLGLALRVLCRANPRFEALRHLDTVLSEAIADIRRWQDPDGRFACDRAVAALQAIRDAVSVTRAAVSNGDATGVSVAVLACSRHLAEAAIEPRDVALGEILRRAETIMCEPLPEELSAWMGGS